VETSTAVKDYVWVFIGCGGTFYAASPYLSILLREYAPSDRPIFIDPDITNVGDWFRQWPSSPPGHSKVHLAAGALGERSDLTLGIVEKFRADDPLLEEKTEGSPVLAIVNVDDDQCGLDVAEWLASRISPGIMVVSGCERDYGQCYAGIWEGGRAILDWRELHSDVGQGHQTSHVCGGQNVRANALTGALVGSCVEDMISWVQCKRQLLREFYWATKKDKNGENLRMWTSWVKCRKPEGCDAETV
jgi:hypothetical protein